MNALRQRLSKTLFSLLMSFMICLPAWAEPVNLGLLKKELIQYHDSGHYQQELSQRIQQARQYIIQQAKQNQNKQKLALVLDIDETSISNYPSMARYNFSDTKEQIHQHILAADAPAIKPTLELYNDAIKHHVSVFFVTGRVEKERSATILNLKRAGYKNWSGLYLRSSDYKKPSIIPFKSSARAEIMKKGYTIIASIGDQCSDIEGGYAKKGFKLPNPFYYLP